MTDTYTANTTPAEAARWLAPARSVVITTHFRPDGDAVGSSLALARALTARDPETRVELWYAGILPQYLDAVIGETPFRHLDTHPPTEADTPDAVVIVDTGAWSQLETLRDFLTPRAERTLIVDHHLSGDPPIADRRIVDGTAAAAAQLVADLCAELLGCTTATLPEPVANPLYMGLATDTGWFRYSSVTPRVFHLAADFIAAGVDHTEIFRIIEQRERPGRIRLFGRAIEALELHDHGRIALTTLTESDFKLAGAKPGDTGGFADRFLAIETVLVAVVLNESHDHAGEQITKISMRSKPGPEAIDVNKAAATLGGGGHARAAGARYAGPIDETKPLVLAALGAS